MKCCASCKRQLPLDQFYRNKGTADGRLGACKDCYFGKHRVRKNRYHKENIRNLKEQTIKAYGEVCYCCGEAQIGFLTLDHANNDGAAKRREKTITGYTFYRWLRAHGFPQDLGLRVACWNCNSARHFNGGICPHEAERQIFMGTHLMLAA